MNDLLQNVYQKDEVLNSFIAAKQRGQQKLPVELTKQDIKLSMRDLTVSKNKPKVLYVKEKMYMPENQELQLFLLQQYYDLKS